jgi:hypothetical protein
VASLDRLINILKWTIQVLINSSPGQVIERIADAAGLDNNVPKPRASNFRQLFYFRREKTSHELYEAKPSALGLREIR